MTPREVTLCLDLLRDIPGPGMHKWDWLIHQARDAGLLRSDIAGRTFEEVICLVHDMRQYYNMGSLIFLKAPPLLASDDYVSEYDLKEALVRKLGLPLLAMRISIKELLHVGNTYYSIDPATLRVVQTKEFTLKVPLPAGSHKKKVELHVKPNTEKYCPGDRGRDGASP